MRLDSAAGLRPAIAEPLRRMRPGPPPRRGRCRRSGGPGRRPPDRTPRGTPAQSLRWSQPARRSSVLADVRERSYFDGQGDGLRQLAAPLQRGIEIGRLDDRESAYILLAL